MTGKYDPGKVLRPLIERLFPPNPRIEFIAPSEIPFALFEYQSRALRELYESIGVNDMVEPKRPVAILPENELPSKVVIGVDISEKPDVSIEQICTRKGNVMLSAGGGNLMVDSLWINGFNANRKAEREVLALAFTTIARARGAAVDRRDSEANPGFSGQGISLRISCCGVGCTIDIDNIHGGTYALIHWYNTEYPARDFTSRFCACVGARNDYTPHHKATSFPADWYSLAMYLDGGLMLASREEAFAS